MVIQHIEEKPLALLLLILKLKRRTDRYGVCLTQPAGRGHM